MEYSFYLLSFTSGPLDFVLDTQSLVIRLVAYFRVEGSCQNRGPKEVEWKPEGTEIRLGLDDVNLQN